MTDATCFLVPPEPDQPFDHSRKVECRALVPVGHPRITLTQQLAEKICDLVAGGKTIRKIGDMEGMPSRATIRRWIEEKEEFTPVVREKKETIARAQLRIATKFKLIGKMAPHKYGDVPPALAPPAPEQPPRDGAGAKVIDGEVIPIEQHPLFDSVEAWRRVAKEAKRAPTPMAPSSFGKTTALRAGIPAGQMGHRARHHGQAQAAAQGGDARGARPDRRPANRAPLPHARL
jgi:hypothetical protein